MTELELLALAGPPPGGELLFTGLIFLIFYVIVFLPMRGKQKKLEQLIKTLKAGDKVIISPGILGTIVAVEDDAFQVRVDEKARLKVLKSAVSGLQPQPQSPTEKK
jgi:preprotein translocase subunit YajC